MDLSLIPVLTAFVVGFAVVAVLTLGAVFAAASQFFAENHTIRVRRHETLFAYYGHLAVGH